MGKIESNSRISVLFSVINNHINIMYWTFSFKFKEYQVAIKTTTANAQLQCLKEYLKYNQAKGKKDKADMAAL